MATKKKIHKTFAEVALTEPHLKAIGLVVAEWAWAEKALELVIWSLLGIEKMGGAVTTHLSSEVRLNIIETVVRDLLKEKDTEKLLSRILKNIATFRKLRTERNNIAHALWGRTESEEPKELPSGKRKVKSAHAYRTKAKGQFIRTVTPYKAAQIRRTAKSIAKLSFALIADSLMLPYAKRKREQAATSRVSPSPAHDHSPTRH